jgi:hypothetical protein
MLYETATKIIICPRRSRRRDGVDEIHGDDRLTDNGEPATVAALTVTSGLQALGISMSAMNSSKPLTLAAGISNVSGSFLSIRSNHREAFVSRCGGRVAVTCMSLTAAMTTVSAKHQFADATPERN